LSATVAAIMYFIIAPKNIITNEVTSSGIENKSGYLTYLENVVPSNIVSPILEGNVLSVLLIAIVIGIAIVNIKNNDNRTMVCNLLDSIQEVAFYIVKFIIRLLPIGIFGFITISVSEFSAGVTVGGLSQYFAVVLSSNLIQGFLVLPLFMLIKRINPIRTAIKMFKALVVAFFTKSSAGTLPVTMQCAEQNNNIHTNVSRFVLPICTTINMNGCAAFILITVLYLMQNHGIEIDLLTMVLWVGIATVAAIGNAGVPMGCYFLSASLLASMNIPIELLGLILPIYAIIDMVETALNVWSDSTVATMVDKDYRKTIS
jgi:Na+/H+-dicarboxylate symporter